MDSCGGSSICTMFRNVGRIRPQLFLCVGNGTMFLVDINSSFYF